MKCPKCETENDGGSIMAEFITIPYQCKKCRCVWTDWQQAEIDRLRAGLERIKEKAAFQSSSFGLEVGSIAAEYLGVKG